MNLANKYRPHRWDEVVGNDSVIKVLNQQLNNNAIKNTYIFSGASGTGKTTIARIFASEINNHNGAPIEIDAASNNGVDNVKQIVHSASERSLNSVYKVYIVDEAHMLTIQAWNALLKTIEEPPKYTIFIFCTTDDHKIPDTIKNRCMRFSFTRIPSNLINDRLLYVSNQEGFTNYEESCDYISRICNGELRNALSLLEAVADYSKDITIENTLAITGTATYDTYFAVVNDIIDGNTDKVFESIDSIYQRGSDLSKFVTSFTEFMLDVVKYLASGNLSLTKIPLSYKKEVEYITKIDCADKYYFYFIDKLLELKNMLKTDSNPKLTIDIMFSQMCRFL